MKLPGEDGFIRVDDWIPKPEEELIKQDGQLVIIEFDKIFDKAENNLNYFIIKKDSYISRMDEFALYINYFLKFYDTEGELLMGYLIMKYSIDIEGITSLESFINMIYAILITPKIKKLIDQMVEDNYYIDLSPKNKTKVYDESLEFTEAHAKVLLSISITMKIITPVVFHYLTTTQQLKNKRIISKIYTDILCIFGQDIDIYSKLYICVAAKINVHYNAHSLMWSQREIVGVTKESHLEHLLAETIIQETIVRMRFHKNVIAFIYVILDNQLKIFNMEDYQQNRVELNTQPDANGLKGIDKIEMNTAKIDESQVVLSKINIKTTMKRLQKKYNVHISDDELNFYKNNVPIIQFQTKLVYYYFAKEFGGYRDLLLLNKTKYIKLLITLKKVLIYRGYEYLPQILTSKVQGKMRSRTIQNNKFISKIETSSVYKNIMANKYDIVAHLGKDDYILKTLSTMLNSVFTIIDYEKQDLIGVPIEVHQDRLSDEFLDFINQI